MAEYKNIIKNEIVISGEQKIKKLKKELAATREQLDKVNSTLQKTKSELGEMQSQFDNFSHNNGIDILQAELERFKNTVEQSVNEFRSFLSYVKLDDVYSYNDDEFKRLFDQIRDGSLTASQAILQIKTNFRALMEENYKKTGGLFDSQVVQQFSASLEKLGETMDIVLHKIDTIEREGVKAVGAGGGNVSAVLNQIETAAHGMSKEIKDSYKSITALVQVMNEYADISELQSGSVTSESFETKFGDIKTAVSDSENAIKAAGESTQSWWQQIENLTEKFNTCFGLTNVITGVYQGIQQMVSSVIELDAAMTELKKVTNETDKRYEQFLSTATTRAKKLSATLTETVIATADFAKLGYNLDEAEKLADAAILYKNVGDGISDISTASESIIATMQAFGIGAEDAIKIVDKFNAVGNNYAISSKDVGDALLRSAASMEAANNSLDETIALAAATNTIIQDPDKVGTTLKTISMFLRAAKTEAEEAGESTEGMANSVYELRDEILSLTKNKVDIQINDDTFKSTYQILKELSGVWGNLTDVSQTNILELIGGKRNSNVVAALLKNFSIAENAVTTSAESAGSALEENEKYLDSINGRIAQFTTAFQMLSKNVVDSEFVKFIFNIGTGIVNILDGLQKMNLLIPSIIGIVTASGLDKKNVGRPKMFGLFEYADSDKCSYGYISFLNAEYGTYIFVNEA